MRFVLIALLCALLGASHPATQAQTFAGPTVREIVEFKRIIQPYDHRTDALREQVSADGLRAFIVTRQADVAGDRNRYEIHLLHLAPERLAARRVPAPETVLSVDVGRDGDYAHPAVQDVRWYDERTLIFLARLKDGPFQVYRLDLPTRELVQLTQEKNHIVSFAASRSPQRLVYAAQIPNPPFRQGARSLVVGNQSFWDVNYGQEDLRTQSRMYRFFVAELAPVQPPRPLGEPFAQGNGAVPHVSISPDGRWALLPRYEPARTMAWARQYPMVEDLVKNYGRSLSIDPLGYFSGASSYTSRRMVAWRLEDGREQTVLDAPDDALPGGGQDRTDRLWQGGGASVLLAGTHLPMGSHDRVSPASHVVEYWPDSGRWAVVATLAGRLEEAYPLKDGFAVVDGGQRRQFRRLPDGGWHETVPTAEPVSDLRRSWTVKVVEASNQPPDVVATGPSGQVVRLTNLNPQFDGDSWGAMQAYSWRDAAGRRWDGGLMAASGMDRRARYPLLIQTYGFARDRFYLDGPNDSDGATSAFAGRAFLREGILVLAMPWNPSTGATTSESRQGIQTFNDGVRGAVAALVKEGRVDPSRIGIIGWSATGERVLNLVTFSGLPIRAATMADADANTLFSLSVTYGANAAMWTHKERVNQGVPFGAKLVSWAHNDPSLHTDCIRAALRIETYGPWVKNNWDLHALLRRQYKPTEMVVIPGGAHALAQPSERMISLQGNVDWYRFWLKGERRTVPLLSAETAASLKAQYDAWDQMATLKAADDVRPRCARVGNSGS